MKKKLNFIFVLTFLSGPVFSQDFQQIKNIISNVNADSLIENLNILTGSKSVTLDDKVVNISSRYRGSSGNLASTIFIKNKLNRYRSLKISEQPLPDSGKNIIAVQTGAKYPNRKIIVCAHFDSHLSGTVSPGADDDGTGTVAVLETARLLSTYSTTNTIVYAFYDREEENMNGSDYYALQASKNKDTIIAVINLDMIGWDKNNQGDVEIDTKAVSTSEQLAKDVKEVNDKCAIGLYLTIVNPGSLDADNASFWKYNYPAILIIELYGYQNPFMHKTTDVVSNINKSFYEKCTKLGIASVARYTDLSIIDGATNIQQDKIPNSFSLSQNYPNPFNPETVISYRVQVASHVTLKVCDLLGREVATLVDDYQKPGNYNSTFSNMNYTFPSGVYFYTLSAGNYVQSKKMVLMK